MIKAEIFISKMKAIYFLTLQHFHCKKTFRINWTKSIAENNLNVSAKPSFAWPLLKKKMLTWPWHRFFCFTCKLGRWQINWNVLVDCVKFIGNEICVGNVFFFSYIWSALSALDLLGIWMVFVRSIVFCWVLDILTCRILWLLCGMELVEYQGWFMVSILI